MRHDKISTAHGSPVQPRIYTCTCCEMVEHTLTSVAPQGWEVELIDGTAYAFCEDCKIDLPEGRRSAGVTATRFGVTSQLDAMELLDLDEEDRRYARQLARIATAERIGQPFLSLMITAIALIGSASVVQHSIRWIFI